jgi:hypothetical protein
LLHNGPSATTRRWRKSGGGYLVTASLPETDALADRFADKWVREQYGWV